jgi:aspartate/methionine/tyrosine aminotransferase
MKIGRGGSAPPFMVMDVIARANAQQRASPPGAPPILRLEVGQPGTGAPEGARSAVQAALRDLHPMGYTEALGLPSLRRRIAAHYRSWYGIEVPFDRIAITSGASAAFPLAFLASFDVGDRIALAAPYYPPYVNILTGLGMQPVILETGSDSRFQPTLAQLDRIDPPPDGLILASPCNPAGTMLAPAEFAAIAAWCEVTGVRLISDEIYHGLNYDAPLATAASFGTTAIVINSFSKYFSMTGWRVGWMVLPEPLVRPVERLAQNMMISAPHISQIAAEAALDCHAELQANVARYRRNRDRLMAALPQSWFNTVPQGAFYLWADLGEGADGPRFCCDLLEQWGIACSPGLDFDAERGQRFVRFSYAGPEAAIAEAADRLGKARGRAPGLA